MRKLVILLVAVASLAFGVSAAVAHNLGPNGGRVYSTHDLCVDNFVAMYHSSTNKPRVIGNTQFTTFVPGIGSFGGLDCSWGSSKPQGYDIQALNIYFWGWGSNSWSLCWATNWQYGSGSNMMIDRSFIDHSPCGSGYYHDQYGAFQWNGAWDGGWVALTDGNGYHYFDW